MFRAIKQHATGPYHGKQRHGMLLLKTKNKSPLLTMSQKINKKHGSIHANMANDMTDSDMAGTTISRHVGELVHFTIEQ